jgi:hypothetical protein
MTGRRILLCALLWITFLCGASAQWKAYPSYYEPTEIEQTSDGMLYVLASGGLFSYNPQDQEVQTYDKTTVLSDCGISHIAWCKAAKKLVIVYSNYNIDLLSANGNVLNMPTYMNTSMTVDKSVYSVDISGSYAYLSTGFGIVKLNVSNGSFADTYQLGFRVDYSYTDNNYIYAASSTNGLYRASLTSNLLNPNEWTRIGDYVSRPKTMDATLLATVNNIKPDGPKYNHFGFLKMYNSKLYTCGGGYDVVSDLNYPGCIQVLDNDKWTIYQDNLQSQTGISYRDVTCLDVDPLNDQHVFAGAINGLYEFNNGSFVKHYSYDNSSLAPTFSNNKEYVVVFGLKYNTNGDLWVLNSLNNEQNILQYTKDSQWNAYFQSDLKGLAMLSQPTIDSRGLLWFVNNNWQKPSFYVYQQEGNVLKSFVLPYINEDGTEVSNINYVRCIAEDKDNNMWIGTDRGPLMLTSDQITATSPIYTQVKVPRNDGTNYADYLLTGVDIRCIYVDKNNRKWFGTTGNGLYIIDSDNITTLAHFTKDNSKLFSDDILALAANESTGEVFIGTDKGLCSYTSNFADNSNGMTKDNVWAYPNPVRPGYTGAITITGLTSGATVKIVTSNGALVNEGTASNGEYKWYGIDRNGKQVVSGVYMVEVATSEGDKGVVCKIAIVR